MKTIFKTLFFILALGVISYQFQDAIRAKVEPLWSEITQLIGGSNPCKEPIYYTLGSFDNKFGISRNYFEEALLEAEKIWEGPSGRELFIYEESSRDRGEVLKVNLVYDYRQDATTKLASIGITVKNTQASYAELKEKFTKLKSEYTLAKANYEMRIRDFNNRQRVYQEQVQYWNKKGGAPEEEYKRLEEERSVLEAQARELESTQTQINEKVDEINAMVVALNRLVLSLNLSVSKYNTIGASRGESFEEGIYESDGINKKIEIYEFSNHEKLVRVLAHEFGHALGLDHVDDPGAIMYELNESDSTTLAKADLDALKIKCGEK